MKTEPRKALLFAIACLHLLFTIPNSFPVFKDAHLLVFKLVAYDVPAGDANRSHQRTEQADQHGSLFSPPPNHLSDGKDAIRLQSIDSHPLPLARLHDRSPPRRIRRCAVDMLVGSPDVLGVCGWCQLFCDVYLLCDFSHDRQIMYDGLAVGYWGNKQFQHSYFNNRRREEELDRNGQPRIPDAAFETWLSILLPVAWACPA